jgi:hypothetical protein
MDAPILTISGRKALEFGAAEVAKLKEYVLRGGTIFGDALCKSAVFTKSFRELGDKMFAREAAARAGQKGAPFTWRMLSEDHPLFTTHYQRVRPAPAMWAMHDGVREILLLCTDGLGEAWQMRAEKQRRTAFELGTNLFFYVTAREPLRTRLRPIFLGTPPAGERTIKVAVLGERPTWPSERYALEQVAHKVADVARLSVEFVAVQPNAAGALTLPRDTTLLWVVGRKWPELPKAAGDAILAYLQGGGMMFATAMAGDPAFTAECRAWLRKRWPSVRFGGLGAGHALVDGDFRFGRPIRGVVRRRGGSKALASVRPPELLSAIGRGRKIPSVIFSPQDVYVSQLSAGVWGLKGYLPQWARQIVANVILYADWAARQPREPVAPDAPAEPAEGAEGGG